MTAQWMERSAEQPAPLPTGQDSAQPMARPGQASSGAMRLTVLGCSGGIGVGRRVPDASPGRSGATPPTSGGGRKATRPGEPMRTSSFLLDDDVLIDAGTGVGDLNIARMARIRHVFLTHSHLDHICSLPLMVDSVGARRGVPLQVHGLAETIEALRLHVFNNVIWPDFTAIPNREAPWVTFHEITAQDAVQVGARVIRPIRAVHTVPAVGYAMMCAAGSIVYSGDTVPDDHFWTDVNAVPNLRHLIIETAFPDRERRIARSARHLHPALLASELVHLRGNPHIHITHMKPSERERIAAEVRAIPAGAGIRVLRTGQVLRVG